MLGAEPAGEDSVVAALDARHVHETCRVAHQAAARKGEPRHRLPTALHDGPRPIADALSALEHVPDHGMRLEALELVEGRERRVLVVEVDHEAHRHEMVVEVVKPRAAAGLVGQGPAHRVLHQTGAELLGPYLPELLDPEAVLLVVAVLV